MFFILKILDHDTKPPNENHLNQYNQEVLDMIFSVEIFYIHSNNQGNYQYIAKVLHQQRKLYTEPRRLSLQRINDCLFNGTSICN